MTQFNTIEDKLNSISLLAQKLDGTIYNQNRVGYLACPYTAIGSTGRKAKKIMDQRFEEITQIAGLLTEKYNIPLICPITTSHVIAEHMLKLGRPLGTKWCSWASIDLAFINKSDYLLLALMDGWSQSTGVRAELEEALRLDIPIITVNPDNLEFGLLPPDLFTPWEITR